MSDCDNSEPVFPEIPREERLQLAQEFWRQSNGAVTITRAAMMYGLRRETLRDRIHGARSRSESHQKLQRLSPGEEKALVDWTLTLGKWGWPARVEQVHGMASALLQAKGDTKALGIHWTDQFLNRHPSLKSKFVTGLEKDRVAAEDPAIARHWFELVKQQITDNAVELQDIFNMDEKGIMMGASEKAKVIISKYEKRQYMTANGSREWVSLLECISATGKALSPWVIFKGKMHKASWMKTLKSGHIALSDNGWTDNELGVAWLKDCFHPETLRYDDSGKPRTRLLIFDGHASHISSEAIQFCLESNIIPLCLPRHSTHLLQPLDVGVFSPYAHYYKKNLANRCRFAAHYSVDKVDFLEILQETRDQTLTETTILSAWEKSGLSPLCPDQVLRQLPERPSTPQPALVPNPHEDSRACFTPRNVVEVEDLVRRVLEGENLDPAIALQFEKLSKAAIKSIADTVTQSLTNKELLEKLKQRKQKTDREKEKDELLSYGRVLGPEILAEREAFAASKRLDIVWKSFLKLDPAALFREKPQKKRAEKSSSRGTNRAFATAVKPFLQLDPAIFTLVISTSWTLDSPADLPPNSQESQEISVSQQTRSGRRVKARRFLGDDS